ncbi:hypothetical protein SDC9_72061 [bioreactor metagenome]|uniref:Sialidase domain-containing protein n=1 Tax=bioreactor metagenome TaxID=1076179 RepID=A0A644YAJ3_9ZZZZ
MKTRARSRLLPFAVIAALLATSLPAAADSGLSVAEAAPVPYLLTVDGKPTALTAYEIEGYPYFALRDLAMALNGTGKQFEVEWDSETGDVSLGLGVPYVPVGGELAVPAGSDAVPAEISSTFFWGCSFCTYVIGDRHYVKLSDLAATLYFKASCDKQMHKAEIDTSKDTICLPVSEGRAAPIDNLANKDAPYSFSIDSDGRVVLSYPAAGHVETVLAPVTLGPEYADRDTYPGVYLSKEKTAVAYGGIGLEPLYVTCSDDMGKTWSTPVMLENSVGVSSLYIGFSTPDDGYLVVGNFHGMGYEDHFVYLTCDGGKTWVQTGNPNGLYARVLTGASFANDQIGFLCYRFETADFSPAICRTTDGGLTYEKLSLKLPPEFDAYISKTPLSPVFTGAHGLLPVVCRMNDAAGTTVTVYFSSKDFGRTWSYEDSGTNP